ncbi:MAG: 30S ribosomal protein S20 [Oscillospiraceae bacterium]|nr:30S ribosomal protein S20 [Oscillospiraceae bacterium]
MPNIRSSAKRDSLSKAANAKNKAGKSNLKTTLKKFDAAANTGDPAQAAGAYKVAVKSVDRAVSKGLIHKNNAARKKSKLARRMNTISSDR